MSTTSERYERLPQAIKEEIGAIPGEDPKMTLGQAERTQARVERLGFWLAAIGGVVSNFLFFYEFGLPRSFLGFLCWVFAIFFVGAGMWMLSGFAVLIISAPFKELIFKRTARQQFFSKVEAAVNRYEADTKSEELTRKAQFDRHLQSDFEVLADFFASGKGHYMPKSLLKFSTDELAKAALEKAAEWSTRRDKTDRDKLQAIEYYRKISLLLDSVMDDDVAELEERMQKTNELLHKHFKPEASTQSPLAKELLKESTELAVNESLTAARAKWAQSHYLSRFQAVFPSSA